MYTYFKFVTSAMSIGTGRPFIVAKIKVRSPILIFPRDLHFRLKFFLLSGKGGFYRTRTLPPPPSGYGYAIYKAKFSCDCSIYILMSRQWLEKDCGVTLSGMYTNLKKTRTPRK